MCVCLEGVGDGSGDFILFGFLLLLVAHFLNVNLVNDKRMLQGQRLDVLKAI